MEQRWTEYTRDIWYCDQCGESWARKEPETFEILCRCDTLMRPSTVTYRIKRPTPDPLEALLEGET